MGKILCYASVAQLVSFSEKLKQNEELDKERYLGKVKVVSSILTWGFMTAVQETLFKYSGCK
jgi:hypothetical protein